MIFSQTIDNIDSEITALLARVEAAKQRQTQLIELDALTDHTLEGLADVVSKIQCSAPDAIASLKSAVLTLFDGNGDDDNGNQPIDPTPDPDEPELLCLNGETGDCLTTADLDDEGDANQPLTYTQAIKNRCGACWGYEVKTKADIKAGFINRSNLNFMEAVNLERTGKEFYQTVEAYLNRFYYNGQACDWEHNWELEPLDGQAWEIATPLCCLLLDIPQHNESNSSTEAEDIAKPPSTKMVHLSANCGYLKLEADGRILSAYAWFSRKAIAQAWMQQIEVIPAANVEMRESKRNPSWKWELKIKGLSMAQVERLSKEALYQKPTKETPAQVAGIEPPRGWGKPQIAPSSKFFVEVLLADSEYYGQTLPVSRVSANEIGYTVSLPNGDSQWFRADVVQVKDAEIEAEESPYIFTTGNYAGLSKQVRQHWERAGVDPSALIADMKVNRPPEPEWDAAKYNPIQRELAAVGADDASDF